MLCGDLAELRESYCHPSAQRSWQDLYTFPKATRANTPCACIHRPQILFSVHTCLYRCPSPRSRCRTTLRQDDWLHFNTRLYFFERSDSIVFRAITFGAIGQLLTTVIGQLAAQPWPHVVHVHVHFANIHLQPYIFALFLMSLSTHSGTPNVYHADSIRADVADRPPHCMSNSHLKFSRQAVLD